MTNTLPTLAHTPDPAETLFEHDLAAGRTGMITDWSGLTPRQRAGYRRAARLGGHTYSLTADRVVPTGTSQHPTGPGHHDGPPGRRRDS